MSDSFVAYLQEESSNNKKSILSATAVGNSVMVGDKKASEYIFQALKTDDAKLYEQYKIYWQTKHPSSNLEIFHRWLFVFCGIDNFITAQIDLYDQIRKLSINDLSANKQQEILLNCNKPVSRKAVSFLCQDYWRNPNKYWESIRAMNNENEGKVLSLFSEAGIVKDQGFWSRCVNEMLYPCSNHVVAVNRTFMKALGVPDELQGNESAMENMGKAWLGIMRNHRCGSPVTKYFLMDKYFIKAYQGNNAKFQPYYQFGTKTYWGNVL